MYNLIGLLLPLLIDLINRKIKDRDARYWISILACVLVGSLMATLENNSFSGMELATIFEAIAIKSMAMFGIAQLTYKGVWENSSVRDDLGLNAKTLK